MSQVLLREDLLSWSEHRVTELVVKALKGRIEEINDNKDGVYVPGEPNLTQERVLETMCAEAGTLDMIDLLSGTNSRLVHEYLFTEENGVRLLGANDGE
jgi:hypothetical protein